MPKTRPLTAAQKRAEVVRKHNNALVDGLASYKYRNHFRNEDVAKQIGIGKATVAALLNGRSVRLDREQWWAVMCAAGLKITRAGFEGGETL